MIDEIAKQVNSNAVALAVGHRIDLRAAVTGYPNLPDATPTGLTVFAVGDDPQLRPFNTPHGAVRFLQLVGVTATDKGEMVDSSTAAVLQGLARDKPAAGHRCRSSARWPEGVSLEAVASAGWPSESYLPKLSTSRGAGEPRLIGRSRDTAS